MEGQTPLGNPGEPEPGSERRGEVRGEPALADPAAGISRIEEELRSFCRAGGLVYAALLDRRGRVGFSICTVGTRPHNECQIGELASRAFASAEALGGEIGDPSPVGVSVQGARWGYSLDRLQNGHLLVGVFPSQELPAIVRASAHKTKRALESVLAGDR